MKEKIKVHSQTAQGGKPAFTRAFVVCQNGFKVQSDDFEFGYESLAIDDVIKKCNKAGIEIEDPREPTLAKKETPRCVDGKGHDFGAESFFSSGGSTKCVSKCERCGVSKIEDNWDHSIGALSKKPIVSYRFY